MNDINIMLISDNDEILAHLILNFGKGQYEGGKAQEYSNQHGKGNQSRFVVEGGYRIKIGRLLRRGLCWKI